VPVWLEVIVWRFDKLLRSLGAAKTPAATEKARRADEKKTMTIVLFWLLKMFYPEGEILVLLTFSGLHIYSDCQE
jgi:hypothetical protein